MKSFVRKWLPSFASAVLWGDRERWGLEVKEEDPCWIEWQRTYGKFYTANQRQGVGTTVNDAGYRVMQNVDLTGKTVLEIGAGDIRHLQYIKGKPKEYIIADVSEEMMGFAAEKLQDNAISYRKVFVTRNEPLSIKASSVDVIISFYSLEHLYPLEPYLQDMCRVLKPGGLLIGAVPSEGGLAWRLGRMLTSRRWFKKNTNIDPDKIICWEHPNYADHLFAEMDRLFVRKDVKFWPLGVPLLDINLILSFQYIKSEDS
jgi:SAM-dependent methyltransferase